MDKVPRQFVSNFAIISRGERDDFPIRSSPLRNSRGVYKGAGNLVTNLALPNSAKITNAYDNVARLSGT